MEQPQFADTRQRGFSALFIVIVLGGVALSLALWVSTSSLWSIRGSIDDRSATQLRGLVNACAEVALEALRENESYTGILNHEIDGHQCSATVSAGTGDERTIQIEGTINTITHRLVVTTSAFNPLTISSWQEVADF